MFPGRPLESLSVKPARDLIEELRSYEHRFDDPRASKITRKAVKQLEQLVQKKRAPRWMSGLKHALATIGLTAGLMYGAYTVENYTAQEPVEYVVPETPVVEPIEVEPLEVKPEEFIEHEITETPVFMYHHIGSQEERYTVAPERLVQHLDWLRTNNYSLTTFSEFVSDPKPFTSVLTFDDSTGDQFSYMEDGSIDPSSAVGILEQYKRSYAAWNVTATFFVNTTPQDDYSLFEQKGFEQEKLEFLVDNGYEIGAHGGTHDDFSKLSTVEIVENLTTFNKDMQVLLPTYEISAFAYPYGALPGEVEQDIVEAFFPYTAHAWGGTATDEQVNVPRIEINPTTQLAAYVPERNVYKQLVAREEHGRSDSQLQAEQTPSDAESDDYMRGRSLNTRESPDVRWEDSFLQYWKEGDYGRSTVSTRQLWCTTSTLRDGNAWSVDWSARKD